jgi:putative transposase
MELENLYFYTATITHWRKLLEPDKYKDILIDSLRHLVRSGKLKVYGFVLIPNHIHVLWELMELNGKEMPHASFMKYTSHQIQKDLQLHHPLVLDVFKVDTDTRKYHF